MSLLFPPAERALPIGLFDAGTRTGLVVEGSWSRGCSPLRVARELLVGGVFGAALADAMAVSHAAAVEGRRRDRRAPSRRVSVVQSVTALLTNRNLLGICLGFFCFDYYWYFLVNWLPDYLVTARGLTMLRRDLCGAALPRVRD